MRIALCQTNCGEDAAANEEQVFGLLERAAGESGFGEPATVGRLFLTDYLVAFEVASLLLLIAAVGAVILARRRTGLADAREISVGELARTPLTKGEGEEGTMLEAGGPAKL